LHHLLIFHKHRDQALTADEGTQACASGRVCFDVVLEELAASEF
jgi:hypothetical protein